MAEEKIIFISGGVRSGKSNFAESYAYELAKAYNKNLYYLATSISFDDEMQKRIDRHQVSRKDSLITWNTIEKSDNIGEISGTFNKDSIVLLDCLTILLNNEFYQADIDERLIVKSSKWFEVRDHIMSGIKNIASEANALVIVSNDVFHDEINVSKYVELYSRMLGELHQLIVQESIQAFTVESSMPILMKG